MATVKQTSKKEFVVSVHGADDFYFRVDEPSEWVTEIANQIQLTDTEESISISPRFHKFDSITEKEFIEGARTGDILLMRKRDSMSSDI